MLAQTQKRQLPTASVLIWVTRCNALHLRSRQLPVSVKPGCLSSPRRLSVSGIFGNPCVPAASTRKASVWKWPRNCKQDSSQLLRTYMKLVRRFVRPLPEGQRTAYIRSHQRQLSPRRDRRRSLGRGGCTALTDWVSAFRQDDVTVAVSFAFVCLFEVTVSQTGLVEYMYASRIET